MNVSTIRIGCKIIGAILILISSFYIGKKIEQTFIKRVEMLHQLKNILLYLVNQIQTSNQVLYQCLQCCAKEFPGECVPLFREAAENLKEGRTNPDKAWSKAVENNKGYLNKQDVVILKELGKLLGTTDREGQEDNIEFVITRLETQHKEAEKARAKDGIMASKLSLAVGAGAIILLL